MNHVFDNLYEFSSFFNKKFQTWSWSEEASPDRIIFIGIGIEITFFNKIIFLFLVLTYLLYILGRGTILKSNIIDIFMSVDIINNSIPSFEVIIGMLIIKIFSDCMEKYIWSIIFHHFIKIVSKIVASKFDIEGGDDGINGVSFNVEVPGWGIVIILYVSE